MRSPIYTFIILAVINAGCKPQFDEGTFGFELQLLDETIDPVVLVSGESMVALSGEFQGRVLTSSSRGMTGRSYGWFDREKVSDGSALTNISSVGGEDRLWYGPEAGPFSVCFKPGTAQIAENVSRSADLDTVVFKLLDQTPGSATFGNRISMVNYTGFSFEIDIERTIAIKSKLEIETDLGISIEEGVYSVGFESSTSMANAGKEDWKKETGLLSIWVLGCFPPSPEAMVVIPVRGRMDSATIYFTEIDERRIKVRDDVVYYRADGDYLNKIGIQPEHTLPVFGSYTPEMDLLTIVKFSFNDEELYVNSHWEQWDSPYNGDVINIFNDGATERSPHFGPFYELESSSAARELKRGETLTHAHATYHFEGEQEKLDRIAKSVFGVGIGEIENALPY